MFFNSLRLSRKVISEYIPVVLLQIYKTTIQIANIYTLQLSQYLSTKDF